MSNTVSPPLTESRADGAGIIAREEAAAVSAIRDALHSLNIDPGNKPIDLRRLPFEGTWGSASTIPRILAGDLVNRDLEKSGELADLSKKEAKQRVNSLVGPKAQELADQIVAHINAQGRFASAEAANGYVNITYDVTSVAGSLLNEVFTKGEKYGWAAPGSRQTRVMIEHSQLNTHKAAHVGHLRCICLGVAVTNISKAGGYPTTPVTYIGDIGRHVINCLWAYINFYKGQEPAADASKGRWLGEIYAESTARLRFRKHALDFLNTLIKEDTFFVEAIDRMLRFLWRTNTVDGEDIAYLLGRVSTQQEIEIEELRDENVIVTFWPMIGDQLRDEAVNAAAAADAAAEAAAVAAEAADDGEPVEESTAPATAAIEPSMTPEERLEAWAELNEHIDWWPHVPTWLNQTTELFQAWERKDPEFVALWQQTRDWSMADLQVIFDEYGARFDHWFWESQVEDAGREIVRDLLQRGIAEVSDGMPVVKIDEQLGLTQETYRTLPILRSDGTTLYATKDLALTRMKFEEYDVDRAIWVVDVRQSLYFDQVSKILEIAGFEQAANAMHLGYEFVALPDGTISSRKGNAPLLEDVQNGMIAHARGVIREKNPTMPEDEQEKVARRVAIGAIKYMMLARDGNKVIVFDPEEALSFEGHAAPYIQYAHARACRIMENGGTSEANIAASLDSLSFSAPAGEELDLLQTISEFPGLVQRTADEYRPLHLTNYVYDLAKRFNDFYHACPVLISEEPVRSARLALVGATAITLRNGLSLLGIEAPEQM